jgi:hypothetical protein
MSGNITNPASQFPITVDGQFDAPNEWSDVTPQPFISQNGTLTAVQPGTAGANSFLYAALDPGRDELYLMYDELFAQQDPHSFPPGQPIGFISFPINIQGVRDVITVQVLAAQQTPQHPSFFDVFVDLGNGAPPVPASQLGIDGAAGFNPSPNSPTPHVEVELGVPLSIPAGFGQGGAFSSSVVGSNNGYSPDPAFWTGGFQGGHGQPGGGSDPLNAGSSALFKINPDASTTVNTDVLVGQVVNVVADHPVNLKSNGLLPVEILSSPTFDPTTIDTSTVQFNGTTVAPRSIQLTDVNGDGIPDLILNYHVRDLVKAGALSGSTTSAVITGQTLGGVIFGGSAVLNIVPKGNGAMIGASAHGGTTTVYLGASAHSSTTLVLIGTLPDSSTITVLIGVTLGDEVIGGSALRHRLPTTT